jgi:hypothetical protein
VLIKEQRGRVSGRMGERGDHTLKKRTKFRYNQPTHHHLTTISPTNSNLSYHTTNKSAAQHNMGMIQQLLTTYITVNTNVLLYSLHMCSSALPYPCPDPAIPFLCPPLPCPALHFIGPALICPTPALLLYAPALPCSLLSPALIVLYIINVAFTPLPLITFSHGMFLIGVWVIVIII